MFSVLLKRYEAVASSNLRDTFLHAPNNFQTIDRELEVLEQVSGAPEEEIAL
ncbi:MAG TPA: hypothetical protein VFD35_06620 [Pricia sp.]|nr:hypothetical protein [Pricia sp.]